MRMLWIRVPRTGSATFRHYMDVVCSSIEGPVRQHASAIELRSKLWDEWEDLFKFGFIRNPWEWLVSMYAANLSEGAWGKELLPGIRIRTMAHANVGFEDWVRARQTTPMDWLSDKNGDVIVDEVRLFEDIAQKARVKLGDKEHPPYQECYSPELAEYVSEKCRREIRLGNYNF